MRRRSSLAKRSRRAERPPGQLSCGSNHTSGRLVRSEPRLRFAWV
jgi:hypothetical protein